MKPKTCKQLLSEFKEKHKEKSLPTGELLVFGIKGDLHIISEEFSDSLCLNEDNIAAEITIYNPTKPVGKTKNKYLLGRVEPRKSEESKVMFFAKKNNEWRVVPDAPILDLQDPFFQEIHGWSVLGGVKIYPDPEKMDRICFQTLFYKYKDSPLELVEKGPFAKGPEGMKDIRLIEISKSKIGVFTRPQGGEAGYGVIGYVEIKSLNELEDAIPKANLLKGMFHQDEWGGVNELHLLNNGKIGVLGHIAHFDRDVRHYYAMSFVFDPKTKEYTHPEILTTASEFPPVEAKHSRLGGVVFTGGLERNEDGTAYLYVGIGDTKAGHIKIPDPFLKYETSF